MLGIILRVVAFLLFLIGACGGTLFNQGELDLFGFALAAWVLATFVGPYGPQWPVRA